MSTPAGWYPDPTGRHQNRWFDGDDWTDQIADGQDVGVDPVRGGGAAPTDGGAAAAAATAAPTPDPGATQAVPVAQPVQPTAVTPAPGAGGAPPPGAPGAPPYADYPGPSGSSSGGGINKGLLIGAAVVIIIVVVGLVLVLGGGDDGGSDNASSNSDQSDSPTETTVEEDPSASDLFDDMADDADADNSDSSDDVFGTDDEPADQPTDTSAGGDYPQEVIDNFNNSCTAQGAPAEFCQCIIDVLQRDVAYDRFVEIDQELAADPTDIPPELDAAVTECQAG